MAPLSAAVHRLVSLLLVLVVHGGKGQEAPRRVVRQGMLTGVKLFTDGRVSVNAYLGIPYAAPPVGHLRFAPPERHPGWNGSMFAGAFASPCPQPRPEALTEDPDGPVSMQLTGEDCLYLNVWTPDNSNSAGGVRGGTPGRLLPVMVFLEGESFVHGSPARFPAMQELSARGLVVVSVAYRLNVFGFLCFGEAVARGNLGLLDQYVALRWVQENAGAFGGDPAKVTLVGHSAGAASAFFHLYSPRTKGLFQGAILMSGSGLAPWALSGRDFSSSTPGSRTEGAGARGGAGAAILASVSIARSLGCAPNTLLDGSASAAAPGPTASREMLSCLRSKTTEELLRAFHTQLKLGNGSAPLVPVADGAFLPPSEQYFPRDPLPCVLREEEDVGGRRGGRRPTPPRPPASVDWTTADWATDSCDKAFSKLDIPVVTGVASHDGVVNLYGRGESLAREGYNQLRSFFESKAVPWAVRQYGVRQDAVAAQAGALSEATTLPLVVQEALRFEYVDRSPDGDTEALLSQLIEFYTDSQFRAPHERQLRFLSRMSTRPVFAYVLEGTSHGGGFGSGGVPGSAPKGTAVNVTGAGHGSDLVLLFGSLAMLRASGRRFSASEERLSDAIQRLWLEFMRQGNPTLNAYGYDPVWRPYGGDGGSSPSRAFMALERQQMRAPSTSGHSSGTGHDLGRRIALWNGFLPRLASALHAAAPQGPQGSKAHDTEVEGESVGPQH
ncbi:acetylcholinesterase-like [Ischnura elegans]|uniref:acetylcholinesterase-like n=1 Tax=Ischnura elegans TaxID=197161 RepID=UPI001ED885C3|nr:acetylcholinesterase-like [Ischnura elegans]